MLISGVEEGETGTTLLDHHVDGKLASVARQPSFGDRFIGKWKSCAKMGHRGGHGPGLFIPGRLSMALVMGLTDKLQI